MTRLIELVAVSRRYAGPPEVDALRNCSLTVDVGDFITIVGPSGSGKSTLLNILGLLDRPTSGAHRLRGEDLTTLTESQRSYVRGANIGFVFQSFHLMDQRTCLENVMLADLYTGKDAKSSSRAAAAALASVGLGERLEALPGQLSGGQQQRVAIARALAGDPAILLCDEPTGNLDSATAGSILDLFDELNRDGRTILLITHDAQVAHRGNRMISILDGTVEEVAPARSSQ